MVVPVPPGQPVPMEDSRFKEVRKLKKKDLPPVLQWLAGQDYLVHEMLGIYSFEMETFKKSSKEAFQIFEKATDKIIQTRQLDYLGIPDFFHSAIRNSWENRADHPFLMGRFDLNGGTDHLETRIIEFNADTFSSVPETLVWQKLQNQETYTSYFSCMEEELVKKLKDLKNRFDFDEVHMIASSLGHPEDVANCNALLLQGYQAGLQCLYKNLEEIIFSEEDGIFYDLGNGDYQPVDIWFKMIPWDWMFTFEPELAQTLSVILEKKLAVILNPPYTSVWQNKKFLSYITEHFPNSCIAETFNEQNGMSLYVKKPVYGRVGENIYLQSEEKKYQTHGDYSTQPVVYQKYYPLAVDEEKYSYQFGMFYSDKPLAFNARIQNSKIITDDCDFISHYLL